MSQVHLQHIEQWNDRHGKPRCYFRRGHGKRIPLPGQPGSPEFMMAYQRALEGSANEPSPQRHRGAPGTFDRLVEEYYRSTDYLSIRQNSQRDYKYLIEALFREDNIGHRRVDQMTRHHVDAIVAKRLNKPGKATRTLSMLRILLDFAVDREWRDNNPTAGFKKIKLGTLHTWTEKEIRIYEQRWKLGTIERAAFDLLLYTGQRSADVIKMTWNTIEEDRISVTQSKTGKKLKIPIHPDLAASLATIARTGQLLILTRHRGQSYNAAGFRSLITKAVAAAGLPKHCVPHGLRKAAARRLAEAGCSSKQIQAITGHDSLSEVERYTEAAEQDELGRSAMARLVKHRTNGDSQT